MRIRSNQLNKSQYGCLVGLTLISILLACTVKIFAQEKPKSIILTHANIIDGISEKPIDNAAILITDGKIAKIGAIKERQGAQVVDLKGKYVMPGLIDAHVHIRDFGAAKRALESGVTTARSMGVSHFTDIGMRELAAAEKIDSPEILAAGYHVRPRPADAFFMDMPEHSDLLEKGVHGEREMRRMARAMIAHKVDWIKTNATARAGLPQTDPREPYYNEAEMRALVEEASKNDLPVAAHAHGDEGGHAAVLGGVRSVEHGTYLSEETLKLMAQKGTYLVPTIAVVADLIHPGGDYDSPLLQIRGRHMYPRIKKTAAMAHKLGVKLVTATDTGYGAESTLRLSLELQEFVGIGLSPFEAIKSATSIAAELLGVDDHTGRIAEGLDADLIVMDRNPLEDIGAVHDLLLVVNNGKIVVNRLVW